MRNPKPQTLRKPLSPHPEPLCRRHHPAPENANPTSAGAAGAAAGFVSGSLGAWAWGIGFRFVLIVGLYRDFSALHNDKMVKACG